MIRVKSNIAFEDKRGDISIDDEGEVTSIVPQSSGKIPVWWDKHKNNPNSAYPCWMNPDDIRISIFWLCINCGTEDQSKKSSMDSKLCDFCWSCMIASTF